MTNLIFCGTKADWQAVTIDEDGREELESVLKYHELVKKEKKFRQPVEKMDQRNIGPVVSVIKCI